jgi:hypothetical protein
VWDVANVNGGIEERGSRIAEAASTGGPDRGVMT